MPSLATALQRIACADHDHAMPPHRQTSLRCPIRCPSYAIHCHCNPVLCRGIPSPTSAIAQPNCSMPPRRVLLRIPSPALLVLIYPSPPLLNAKLSFPLPARCPAFPVFSRPLLCTPVLCPRHATPCHAFAPQCNADAQQCHAFASALRCDALPLLFAAMQCHAPALLFMTHAPQINPAPFRCHSILCIPIAWKCLAMPALRQTLPSQSQSSPSPCFASHRPRIAGPSIAVTVLFPAEPPLRLATQATAAPCPAVPPLSGAPPRFCLPVLIPALAPHCGASDCRRFPGQSFA